jgi:hypothetical protein
MKEIEAYSQNYLVESNALCREGAGGRCCQSTEYYFQRTLHEYRHHRNSVDEDASMKYGGCAVYVGDKPVGLVKHYKSELLLAVSTVKDASDAYNVIRGGVYKTDLAFDREGDKPRWSYKDDGVAVRSARRLDETQFASGVNPSTIDELLGEAEEAMGEMRDREVEL